MGYRNKTGPAGTRNLLGIVTTVQCAAGVVNVAVERIKRELLPKYPNVDGVVAVNHPYCSNRVDSRNRLRVSSGARIRKIVNGRR